MLKRLRDKEYQLSKFIFMAEIKLEQLNYINTFINFCKLKSKLLPISTLMFSVKINNNILKTTMSLLAA
jgi:hypothetical protein